MRKQSGDKSLHLLNISSQSLSVKGHWRDSQGGSVVENPPAHSRYTGSISGPGRPHRLQSNQACVPQLLTAPSRAHQLQLLNPACPQQEKPPSALQLERSLQAATKTQCIKKKKKKPLEMQLLSDTVRFIILQRGGMHTPGPGRVKVKNKLGGSR